MKKKCNCSSFQLINNVDPTRTKTLRNRFVTEITKRFKIISSLIKTSVVENDCFGLKEQPHTITFQQVATPRQFDFPRNSDKVEAFIEWLREQQENEIFELITRDRIGGGAEELWTNIYIDSSYQQGIRRAREELRKAGIDIPDYGDKIQDPITAAFNQPVHADRVGLLYTRVYSELKGITEAMDQAISRTLATGLVEGIGGDELAKRLLRDVENIGINRARMLARTEVIRAHHSATIQSYKNAAVENVIIQAEFSTAGDLRVCQKCNDLNGKIFTLDEIEPIIPVHPNCRCIALPYFPTEIEKKKIESNKWAVYEGKILNTPKRIRKAVLDLNTILSSLELIKDYKRRINELSNKIDDLYRSDLATVEIAKEKFKLSKEIEELKNKMILIEREEINKIFHSPIKSDIDFIIHDNFGELDLKRIKEETELITDWLGYKTFDFPSCYIQKTDSLRSHYSNFQIRLSPVFSKGSTTHEIGHWFEEQIPGALDKTKEFLEKRTGNNPLIPLGEGFSDNEYYRKGFKNRYVGKDYSRDPNDRSTVYATEVLSIGLETLYLDPIAFAYEDPEFFEFIIGLLKDML